LFVFSAEPRAISDAANSRAAGLTMDVI
jgi:hypothetical protein